MESKKLVIIGAGPGGYTAALAGAQKGLDVTLIENRQLGGTCLNRGCIPTKALLACAHTYEKVKNSASFGITAENISFDLHTIQARKEKVVAGLRSGIESLMKKFNVNVVKAQAKIMEKGTVSAGSQIFNYDYLIIATGSEPLRIWNNPEIITSDEALGLEKVPQTLLVIGAGAVGLEFASFWNALGTKVTVAEMLPKILPSFDAEITDTLVRELKKSKITVKTGCKAEKIEHGKVTFADGKEETYDLILQAAGRKYNTDNLGLEHLDIKLEKGRIATDDRMETGEKNVYAIGDCASFYPLLAHTASAQAITAVKNIAGETDSFNHPVIPGCIYTHPEVACAGLREDEVPGAITAKIPMRLMGRSHAEGEIAGLLKIVADPEHTIKGVHIIGERATDIIAEGTLAIARGMKIKELSAVIRAHPTFAEIYSEAFHNMEGIHIHA